MNTQQMLDRHLAGWSYGQIANAAGVSRQYVHHQLAAPTAIRSYVTKRAEHRCENCDLYVGAGDGHIHQQGTTKLDDYSDVDALMLLCGSCHRQLHPPTKDPGNPKP